ncbi:unnamed protein product (macronuclear) [Paramecium tetraurelia]|uniref:Transmembrane protein n=1 Tax=Paramecium tetraurelia TaxID=5888 RepID=A0EBC2_PARTE|nr:uncharacterized protein GSPATT00025323001 [Paramecium tetraurelia]CAK92589.1 unnamed protein product [Paramecium tetraurelia]|eukprot:XP_001459986.1 hypothetical protein (macronuclear) [Paramecium tetraurelia strain d4-2]
MQTKNSFDIAPAETMLLKDSQQKKQVRFRQALVAGLILAAVLSLTIVFVPKGESVPTYTLNQRSSYYSQDQLCVYQVSTGSTNCTQIAANTTTVTVDSNQQNTTHMIILEGVQVTQNTTYSNGTVVHDNLFDANLNISSELSRNLRLLQLQADGCYGPCYDEMPVVTFVTDNQNGQVIDIGVPQSLNGLMLQTLIATVQHLGPNVQGTEVDQDSIVNPYIVGKYEFVATRDVETSWFGNTKVTKQVTQDDCLNENFLIGDQFSQNQTTTLSRQNQIVSSSISVNIVMDHSVQPEGADVEYSYKTIVSDESNLVLSNSQIDVQFTQLLQEIRSKQNIQTYSLTTIQDRLIKNKQKRSLNMYEMKQKADKHRLLISESLPNNSLHCPSNGLINFQKTVLTFSVKGTKLQLDLALKGTAGNGIADLNVKFCVAMEGMCLFEIINSNLNYTGQPFRDIELNGMQNISLFETELVVQGFTVGVGADFSYGFLVQQNVEQNATVFAVQDTFIVPVLLTVYGESSIPDLVAVRTAVVADIFTGNVTSNVAFGYNQKIQSINTNAYTLNLNLDMEEFRAIVIAQYQHSELSTKQKCKRHLGFFKVCYPVPIAGLLGDWQNLYYNNWGFPVLVQNFTLYGVQSDCFMKNE